MRLAELGRAGLIACLAKVQQTREHEVADLLDDGDGIGDTTGVELEPEGVDFGFEAGGNHEGEKSEGLSEDLRDGWSSVGKGLSGLFAVELSVYFLGTWGDGSRNQGR